MHDLSIFLTSNALNKDIFSCEAKSARVILSVAKPQCGWRSRTAEQCEAKPSRISGANIILSPRRSRCYASPYGFDCGRRTRLPPLRMTRGVTHRPEGSKKHFMEITCHKCLCYFCHLLYVFFMSLIKP